MTTCKECGAQISKGKELLHARWHGEVGARPYQPVQPYVVYTPPAIVQQPWYSDWAPDTTPTITWKQPFTNIGSASHIQ